MVMSQKPRLSTAMIGVPARIRVSRRNERGPTERHITTGRRMCTSQVCKYPLYQRERCRIQLMVSLLASSSVVESSTAVRNPSA